MTYLLKIVAIISVCLVVYKIILKILQKILSKKTQLADKKYLRADDKNAQVIYKKSISDIIFTKDQAIELSWQFLYDITEYILSKFSKEDKEETEKIGIALIEKGMQYHHVIEFGLRHDVEKKAKRVLRKRTKMKTQKLDRTI